MNRQDFNQLGGFPLETDNFDWMQKAYEILNALGYIAGNKTIISGCIVTGSTISDGVVFLDGEVYKFVGGNIQNTVRVLENETTKVFENGEEHVVHIERYITFASGAGAINWSEFKRIDSMVNLQSRILPPGTNPQLYSGAVADIPEGWELCDGGTYNGITVPDIRKRFIVGYDPTDTDYNAIGKTGGLKGVSLTKEQLPDYDLTGNITIDPHKHDLPNTVYSKEGGSGDDNTFSNASNTGKTDVTETSLSDQQNVNVSINSGGDNEPHENRPPYYTLAYIIYVGT